MKLEFDETVEDAEDSDNPVALKLEIGRNTRSMTPRYDGSDLYFEYTVTWEDYDPDGFSIPANALSGSFNYDGDTFDFSDLTHDATVRCESSSPAAIQWAI